MAGNLHVRNLDDDLIARLKRRAAPHGRSTSRAIAAHAVFV
jgi:plasmid stability protein